MSVDTGVLFSPLSIKTLNLKNRFVMAPMTRTFAINGVPGQLQAEYYRKRIEGEVGLILSEGTVVERPGSSNHQNIPNFYGDAALAGWKTVIDSVHQAGGKMGPQIWHVGAVPTNGDWAERGQIEGPSGLNSPGKELGVAMTEEDIADTVQAFARSAREAKALGFDTVEIHGAHGYLIDQFFWSGTNLREDQYGGSTIAERSRLAAEIVAAIRVEVGEDFPIILRVSQWKQQDYNARLANTPDEMTDWLLPLVEAGVDILHCSQRRYWEPEFADIDGKDGLNFAGWAKKLTGATTISVGSVGLSGEFLSAFKGESSTASGIENLIARMEKNEFDLIAVGRALITDPMWVKKVREGKMEELKGFSPASLAELV